MAPKLLQHPQRLTIMSDRMKGLDNAVHAVFPNCHQRFCFRHMMKNFRRKYQGVDEIVWAAAKSYKQTEFNRRMRELDEKEEHQARLWLEGEHESLWARSHFDHNSKSDHNTNNFTECFNAYIIHARDKPIVILVNRIQTLLMKLIHTRRTISATWEDNQLVPRVADYIKRMKAFQKEYTVGGASDHNFQVTHMLGTWWEVNLEARTCTCCKWQITGYPCIHAICVIAPRRLPWHDYVHPFMLGSSYKEAYSGMIRPMLHESDWDEPQPLILPPIRRRAPGRPRVRRIRGDDEGAATSNSRNRCSRCGDFTHNARTCQGGPVGGNDRGGRGRGAGPVNNRGGWPRTSAPRVVIREEDLPPAEGRGRGRGGRVNVGRGRGNVIEENLEVGGQPIARGRGSRDPRGGRGRGRGSVTEEAVVGGGNSVQGGARGRGSRGGRGRGSVTQEAVVGGGNSVQGGARGRGSRGGRGSQCGAAANVVEHRVTQQATVGGVNSVQGGASVRGAGHAANVVQPRVTRSTSTIQSAVQGNPTHTRYQPERALYMRPPRHPNSQVFQPSQSSQASNRVSGSTSTSSG
ncbi:hypothetical protein ACHQM5_028302 [Ranunculus cassubicifolius]